MKVVDYEIISKEFLVELLEFSLNFQINQETYLGFQYIKILTDISFDLIENHLEQIFHLINMKFSIKKKNSEKFHQMIDHCLSCLSKIALKININKFPFNNDFINKSFENMPATIDLEENLIIFEYYFWLIEHLSNIEPQILVTVLIKFFSLSNLNVNNLFQNEFLNNLKNMLKILLNKIPNSEKFCSNILKNNSSKLQILSNWLN